MHGCCKEIDGAVGITLRLLFDYYRKKPRTPCAARLPRFFFKMPKICAIMIKPLRRSGFRDKGVRTKSWTMPMVRIQSGIPEDLYILDILSATLRVSGGLGLLFFQVLQFFLKAIFGSFCCPSGFEPMIRSKAESFEAWRPF